MSLIKTTEKDLRNFGFLVGGVFLLIAFFNWKNSGELFPYFLVIGGVLIFLGSLRPTLLFLPYTYWMKLAELLSAVMTRVILTIVFYLILTPLALISRLFGKKFLDFSFKSNRDTYWEKRSIEERSSVENQF